MTICIGLHVTNRMKRYDLRENREKTFIVNKGKNQRYQFIRSVDMRGLS